MKIFFLLKFLPQNYIVYILKHLIDFFLLEVSTLNKVMNAWCSNMFNTFAETYPKYGPDRKCAWTDRRVAQLTVRLVYHVKLHRSPTQNA